MSKQENKQENKQANKQEQEQANKQEQEQQANIIRRIARQLFKAEQVNTEPLQLIQPQTDKQRAKDLITLSKLFFIVLYYYRTETDVNIKEIAEILNTNVRTLRDVTRRNFGIPTNKFIEVIKAIVFIRELQQPENINRTAAEIRELSNTPVNIAEWASREILNKPYTKLNRYRVKPEILKGKQRRTLNRIKNNVQRKNALIRYSKAEIKKDLKERINKIAWSLEK